MKYNNWYNSIIFFYFAIMSNLLVTQAEIIDYNIPDNIYRFANYLYEEGDYQRALGEFQRYLFASGELPQNADSVLYKMGICFRFMGDLPRSIDCFEKIIDCIPNSSYKSAAYYQIALTYTLLGKNDESIKFIFSKSHFINQENFKLKMKNLVALNYLLQKNWNSSIEYLNNLDEITKKDSLTSLVINYAKEGKRLPRKSKVLAGIFSSIIPGTGKMYCNRSWDGFFSLITIGLTGWQAYQGFHREGSKSIKGLFWGSISATFYIGNIYGSIVSAKIYNEQQEERFLSKIKLLLNVNFQ